jgi:hypothetical protein
MGKKLLFVCYDTGRNNFVCYVFDYRQRLRSSLESHCAFYPHFRVVCAVYFEDHCLPVIEWRCRGFLSDPQSVGYFRRLLNTSVPSAVPRVVRVQSYGGSWVDYPLLQYSAAGGGSGFYTVPAHQGMRDDDVRIVGVLGSVFYLPGINYLFYNSLSDSARFGAASSPGVPVSGRPPGLSLLNGLPGGFIF